MSAHQAEVIIVTCIDFRLQEYINNWISQNFKAQTFDRVAFAGGVKDLENILKQIKAEKEKVKFSLFGVNGQAIGAFFENNDTSSMPISNFWFNKWQ